MTCNWACGKRRGFSPWATACHRGRTRAPMDCLSQSPLSPPFFARSDVWDVGFQIWQLCQTTIYIHTYMYMYIHTYMHTYIHQTTMSDLKTMPDNYVRFQIRRLRRAISRNQTPQTSIWTIRTSQTSDLKLMSEDEDVQSQKKWGKVLEKEGQ